MNFVNRLLFGKTSGAISTAAVDNVFQDTALAVAGDIFVIDRQGTVLNATTAVGVSEIFIAAFTGAGASNLILSSPIARKTVTAFTEQPFAPQTQQTDSYAAMAAAPVAGKVYKLNIIFHDEQRLIANRRLQRTYYVTAGPNAAGVAETSASLYDKFRTQIANDPFMAGLITTNAAGSATLNIVGLAVPTRTINDYVLVTFETLLLVLDGQDQFVDGTPVSTLTRTAAVAGTGTPDQLRKLERFALGYLGVTDLRDFRTNGDVPYQSSKGHGYSIINLIHADEHVFQLEQVGKSPLQTTIACPTTAIGGATVTAQYDAICGILEAFMSIASSFAGAAAQEPLAPEV